MASTGLKSFPAEETLECPKCAATITLYDPEGSEICTCRVCNCYIKFNNNLPVRTNLKLNLAKRLPVVPIGSAFIFREKEYILVAFFIKKEALNHYEWAEYLLYNYETGYATLAEYNGHWTFTPSTPQEIIHEKKESSFYLEGKLYKKYNIYDVVVKSMIGECDWDIANEKLTVREFICPPEIMFYEFTKNNPENGQYYLGEYIYPDEIAKSFSISKSSLPSKTGIGACEPNRWIIEFRKAVWISGLAIIIMLISLYFNSKLKPSQNLLKEKFTLSRIENSNDNIEFEPIISESFTLKEKYSNLEFNISSNVINNWLDANMVLVNEKNNHIWEINKGIEFYQGYEDGEQWSEGSQSAKIMMSKIPAGQYHINIYPISSDSFLQYLDITVRANNILWRNIIITSLLLIIYPVFLWYMSDRMEKLR